MDSFPFYRSIKRHADLTWLAFLVILGLVVFGAGLHIPYYGDDYGYILDPSRISLFSFWSQSNLHGWYRPLQMMYMSFVQQYWGWSTLPIHALQLLLHIGLAFLVYYAGLKLDLNRLQSGIASLWFLVSQVDPIAV